jgi:hypothetical protein
MTRARGGQQRLAGSCRNPGRRFAWRWHIEVLW